MAIKTCDAVRASCDDLRKASELHDPVVAKAETAVRAAPEDEGLKSTAEAAYVEKCRMMNAVLSQNIDLIDSRLEEARTSIEQETEQLELIEQENSQLKLEKKTLKEQLEEERVKNDAAKTEESKLDGQLIEATKAAQTARKAAAQYEEKGPFTYRTNMGSAFQKLIDAKVSLLGHFEKYKVLFMHRNTALRPQGHGYGMLP